MRELGKSIRGGQCTQIIIDRGNAFVFRRMTSVYLNASESKKKPKGGCSIENHFIMAEEDGVWKDLTLLSQNCLYRKFDFLSLIS